MYDNIIKTRKFVVIELMQYFLCPVPVFAYSPSRTAVLHSFMCGYLFIDSGLCLAFIITVCANLTVMHNISFHKFPGVCKKTNNLAEPQTQCLRSYKSSFPFSLK